MTEVTVELIEKNFDSILEQVGKQSFVDWDGFTKHLNGSAKAVSDLTAALNIFKDCQNKASVQAMKRLKGYDLPDLITIVAAKKLPREALKTAFGNFKVESDGQLKLLDDGPTLKAKAKAAYDQYTARVTKINEQIAKWTEFLNQKIKQSGFEVQKHQEWKEIKATVKFNISPEKIKEAAMKIDVQFMPQTVNLISIKTYSQIVECTFNVVQDQYIRLTEQTRVEQRKHTKNAAKYLEVMLDYVNNCEALIIEGQRTLAEKVGLTPKKFEQSELALMERGLANNILIIQSTLRSKIKQCIPAKKDVKLDQAKEIIKFQTEMIMSQADYLKQVFANLSKTQESAQLIPMLLAITLNDMVFEKYGYEEQDFMKNVGQKAIETNQQLQALFKDMEIAIIRLMRKLQVVPPEVAQYMEQQALARNLASLGGPTQQRGDLPAGMLPGSNPMDLLQAQQVQQLQQMFSQMRPDI